MNRDKVRPATVSVVPNWAGRSGSVGALRSIESGGSAAYTPSSTVNSNELGLMPAVPPAIFTVSVDIMCLNPAGPLNSNCIELPSGDQYINAHGSFVAAVGHSANSVRFRSPFDQQVKW